MTVPAPSRRLDRLVGRPRSYRCSCCKVLTRRLRCGSSTSFEPHSPVGAQRLALTHSLFFVALPRPVRVTVENVVSDCYVWAT